MHTHIPKYLNRAKFTGFYKNNECMHLYKRKKVYNAIYCQFFSWRLLRTEMVNCKDFSEAATWDVLLKEGALKNFAKLTGKHLRWSLYFNRFACLRSAISLKERLWHSWFSMNSLKFLRTPFSQDTSEQLLLNFTNENKASENEISNWWFYLFWGFICRPYT